VDDSLGGLPVVDLDTLTRHPPPMTERQLQDAVLEMAGYLGYLCYHTYDSRRSAPGYPDVCIVGHGRCIMAEIKRERGRVSAAQQQWLDELALAGLEVYVLRPWHWHSGEIERILRGDVNED
jgi:hypothetical protein